MNIISFTTLYPNAAQPVHGIFVENRLRRLAESGKVSLTVSLRFQDPERTLTSEEVQAAVDGVVRELHDAGLEIRGE